MEVVLGGSCLVGNCPYNIAYHNIQGVQIKTSNCE